MASGAVHRVIEEAQFMNFNSGNNSWVGVKTVYTGSHGWVFMCLFDACFVPLKRTLSLINLGCFSSVL